jgi:hypothetical protein
LTDAADLRENDIATEHNDTHLGGNCHIRWHINVDVVLDRYQLASAIEQFAADVIKEMERCHGVKAIGRVNSMKTLSR